MKLFVVFLAAFALMTSGYFVNPLSSLQLTTPVEVSDTDECDKGNVSPLEEEHIFHQKDSFVPDAISFRQVYPPPVLEGPQREVPALRKPPSFA